MMTHDQLKQTNRVVVDSLELDVATACRVVGRREWSSAVTIVANRPLTNAELVRCRALAWRCNVDLTLDADGAVTVRSGRTAVVPRAKQRPLVEWLRSWHARRRHEAMPVVTRGVQ